MVGTDRVSFGPKRLRGLRHGWKCLGVDRNDRFQDWPTGDPWRKLWQLERRNHSARGESTFHDTERSDRFQNRWEPSIVARLAAHCLPLLSLMAWVTLLNSSAGLNRSLLDGIARGWNMISWRQSEIGRHIPI